MQTVLDSKYVAEFLRMFCDSKFKREFGEDVFVSARIVVPGHVVVSVFFQDPAGMEGP
jgi:hypothetical protein